MTLTQIIVFALLSAALAGVGYSYGHKAGQEDERERICRALDGVITPVRRLSYRWLRAMTE